jgi:uncharacterized protein YjbI with pentapeptide repeats
MSPPLPNVLETHGNPARGCRDAAQSVARGAVDGERGAARTETPRVASTIYQRLATATPTERAEIVLRLIEEHPQGRLELPAHDGLHAVLDEINLGAEAIESRGDRLVGVPWWDSELRGVCLRGADLRGASLRGAELARACLEQANLQDIQLGQANLQAAKLDGADLRHADLAGVNLAGAALHGADLRGTMLEEANMQQASIRFANLTDAVLEATILRQADLWGANCESAVLTNADLRGASLQETILRRADLSGANLQEAVLGRADLRGAVLRDAKLQGVDLSHSEIAHVHLSGARLEETRFEREQLGGAIGEDLAGAPKLARKGYLALERAFEELGDHDAASWAYRKRRRMQKRVSLEEARSARTAGRWGQALKSYAVCGTDQAVEWLCDYGESIPRVLASLLALYLFFTVVYGVTGSVVRELETPTGIVKVPTQQPRDLAIFGLLAMTIGSIGMRLLPAHDFALILVGIHVFLGVALIGLLGFVLGNRIRR